MNTQLKIKHKHANLQLCVQIPLACLDTQVENITSSDTPGYQTEFVSKHLCRYSCRCDDTLAAFLISSLWSLFDFFILLPLKLTHTAC